MPQPSLRERLTIRIRKSPQVRVRSGGRTDARTVTQTLCAAVYLCDGLARYVTRNLDRERSTALAPPVAIDLLALLRHATAALRVQRHRDWLMLALLLAAAGTVIADVEVRLGRVPASAAAMGAVCLWFFRARLGRWMATSHASTEDGADRPGGRRARHAAVLLFSVAVLVLLAAVQRDVRLCLAVALAAITLSWLACVGELLSAQRRAGMVLAGTAEPRELAPPLPDRVEARIADSVPGNLVVYGAVRAAAPFVGNGHRVRPWSLDIDVHRGAVDDSGRERVPEEIDVVELYEFLGQQFAVETAVEATPFRQLSAGYRLYVEGTSIRWNSTLLTGEPPLPRHDLDWHELTDVVRRSDNTDRQRLYFFLQEVSRGGEITVAVFVRPFLHGAHLSVELVPQVILPVDDGVEAAVTGLPGHALDRWWAALTSATPAAYRMLLDSPTRCATRAGDWLAGHRARWRWRRAARRCRPYDFGAPISVREGVSVARPQRLSHFVTTDLSRISTYLQARIVASIKQFLDQRGVDTELLDERSGTSVTNIQNWSVGDVRADMVGFGNDNWFEGRPRDSDEKKGRETP